MFPLAFVANTFVPTEGMPDWLQPIAEWNPISAVTAACRELFGNPTAHARRRAVAAAARRPASVLWSLLIIAVCLPLAVRRYRTASPAELGQRFQLGAPRDVARTFEEPCVPTAARLERRPHLAAGGRERLARPAPAAPPSVRGTRRARDGWRRRPPAAVRPPMLGEGSPPRLHCSCAGLARRPSRARGSRRRVRSVAMRVGDRLADLAQPEDRARRGQLATDRGDHLLAALAARDVGVRWRPARSCASRA